MPSQPKPKKFKPRPGRPSAAQAAAIAGAILTAATEVFLEQGFEAASMEAIALKAKVPKSTLYKRYPDKRALLKAVISVRVRAWSLSASRKNWMLGNTLEQRLKRLCVIALTHALDPEVRAYARLAASAWSGPNDIERRQDVIGFSEMVDFLEHEIRAQGAADGLHATSPRSVAIALMAMLAGWLELRRSDQPVSRKDISAFAGTSVSLLIKGRAAW